MEQFLAVVMNAFSCFCAHNVLIFYLGDKVDSKYYSGNYGNLIDGNRNSCDQMRPSVTVNFTQQIFIWRVEIVIKKWNSSEEERKERKVIRN